ncbi:hypothetical protein TanjilG_00564 [Lupinus angustifolius]|nr:hypothetical protein TanjilG_00564 [Lupinus angustifolius]
MPSKVLGFKTPLQALATHFTLPLSSIISPRVFGCVVFVHLHKSQRTKFDPCVVKCVFLGYATNKKGYCCYDSTTKRHYTIMDATFLETENYYSTSCTTSHLQGEIGSEDMKLWDCPEVENVGYNVLVDKINTKEEVVIVDDNDSNLNNMDVINVDDAIPNENDIIIVDTGNGATNDDIDVSSPLSFVHTTMMFLRMSMR